MPDDTDRRWDTFWDVYWAKHSSDQYHDRKAGAWIDATIYCRKHDIPIPSRLET
jgi:hypothetical protein